MNRDEILDVIFDLSKSQGFYGRLYRDLMDKKENYPEIYEAIMDDLEAENFMDTLDMVLYFES